MHLEDKFGGVAGRVNQIRALLDSRLAHRGPCVVAGDLNTFDSPLARLVRPDATKALGKPYCSTEAAWWRGALLPGTGFADPFGARDWTFRIGGLFRSKLDWILAKGCVVRQYGMAPMAPSDHRPIWVDLQT